MPGAWPGRESTPKSGDVGRADNGMSRGDGAERVDGVGKGFELEGFCQDCGTSESERTALAPPLCQCTK